MPPDLARGTVRAGRRHIDHVDLPDSPDGLDHDLVPVGDPWIRVMGAYFHEGWPHAVPGAWLRPRAYERLLHAADGLPAGFGLAVWGRLADPRLRAALHDRVYRDTSLAPGFVAYPDRDPRRCPPHATGGDGRSDTLRTATRRLLGTWSTRSSRGVGSFT